MKKMNLIKRYQESGNIQEILDKINEKYRYKLTKEGVGKFIEHELTEESRLKSFLREFKKNGYISEDAFLKGLNSLIYSKYIYNSINGELRHTTENYFQDYLLYIIERMRSEIKILLELCPEASEK